uniref:DEAD/DEAH-box helicase domain-containing protein n=1 Tax=Kalanchoe fedtschenkoi TaxID=63787 RepID=A0A7N0UYS0_KALFE
MNYSRGRCPRGWGEEVEVALVVQRELSEEEILCSMCRGISGRITSSSAAAFCIPTLEKNDPEKNVIQVMIVVPTRELALQASQYCKVLGKHLQIQVVITTGITSLKDNINIMCLYQSVYLLLGLLEVFYILQRRARVF